MKRKHFATVADAQSYEGGEPVGPYNVAPGKPAVMRAGWVVSDFAGEKTVCGQDGQYDDNCQADQLAFE